MLTDLASLTLAQLRELQALYPADSPTRAAIDRAIIEQGSSCRKYRPSQVPDELKRESDFEQDVDARLEALGFEITRLSQPRASKQTPGISDRYVRHVGRKMRIWIEIKWGRNELTPQQKRWQQTERDAGGDAIAIWTMQDLEDELRHRGFDI